MSTIQIAGPIDTETLDAIRSATLIAFVADGHAAISRVDMGGTDTTRLIDVLEGRAPGVDLTAVLGDPDEWWDPADPDLGLADAA